MSKVHARSHETANKHYEFVQNFEGEANNMQLDKEDTGRSNWNSKCVFTILILLFVFIMSNKLTYL